MAESLQLNRPVTTIPALQEQTSWPCGYYDFPKRYKVQYFNPGLVDWQGHRWLVTRRRRCAIMPAMNDISMWRLSASNQPLGEYPVKIHSVRLDEHWEDPRAINVNGQLWISYSNFYTRCAFVHQAIARVNHQFQSVDICHPNFEGNGDSIKRQAGHEKNWLWFEPRTDQGGNLLMIYSANPHRVVRLGGKSEVPKEWITRGVKWRHGVIRGGTPPVYVPSDDLFWTFFHSSIELGPTAPRRRYYMGAYGFDPEPPFKIRRRTPYPILIGSELDRRDDGAPLCVFPCGSLLDLPTARWHVTLGVNDVACAWIMVPHDDLRDQSIRVRT